MSVVTRRLGSEQAAIGVEPPARDAGAQRLRFRATVRAGGENPCVDASTSGGGVPCTPHTPKQRNGRPHINGCVRCEAAKTGASKHGPEHMAAIGSLRGLRLWLWDRESDLIPRRVERRWTAVRGTRGTSAQADHRRRA